jgi:ATP-binding cassette subfamily C protein CydD
MTPSCSAISNLSCKTVKNLSDQNQHYFEQHKRREGDCAAWLRTLEKNVRGLINIPVGIEVGATLLLIIQAWLLSGILQALVIDGKSWSEIQTDCLFLIVLFLGRSIGAYAFHTTGFTIAAQVRQQIQQQLIEKLEKTDWCQFAFSSGATATIIQQQAEALDGYFQRYLPLKRVVVWVPLLILSGVFYVNWLVGVILLVTGPLIPLFMMLIGMGAESASRRQFLQMSRMSGFFLDRIQGLETLKLFGRAQTELANIRKVSEQFTENTMAVLRIAFLSSAVLEFFSAVAVALVAVYVGLGLLGLVHFGPAEHITLQQALFVLLLAPEFFLPLRQLAVHYHDRAQALAAADQILKILELPEVHPDSSVKSKASVAVDCQGISKSYGQKQILKNIHLTLQTGEKAVLVGESGTGKTTLLKIIAALLPADQGQIQRAGNVTWCGQKPTIFTGTLAENIALFDSSISADAIERAADQAGVSDFARQLPDKLQTRIGENGFGLSGGQKQRVALARAFLQNHDIILLDEPTAHLDRDSKKQMLAIIDQLFSDKTLLIASHDPVVTQHFTRRLTLHQGRLL